MELLVVTFNIDRLFTNREVEFKWDKKEERVCYVIEKISADILGIQEAREKHIRAIKENNNDYKYFKGIEIDNGDGTRTSNPIFWNSRFDMIKCNSIYLADRIDNSSEIWDSKKIGTATWVLLFDKLYQSRIIVINTQLDDKGTYARKKRIELLVTIINNIVKTECCSAILTCDMNSYTFLDGGLKYTYIETEHINKLKSLHSSSVNMQLVFLYSVNNIENISYELFDDGIISDNYPVICKYRIVQSLEDCLYFGRNRVFRLCSKGIALHKIADYLREKYTNDLEKLKERVLKQDFLEITRSDKAGIYDYSSSNAIIQNGVVQILYKDGQEYIIKRINPRKKKNLDNELNMYNKLNRIFNGRQKIGWLGNKEAFFEIVPPINILDAKEQEFSIMKKLEGISLEDMCYSYEKFDYRLLNLYVQIIYSFIKVGFVCMDICPRNIIVKSDEESIIFYIIDFEKSYFIENEITENILDSFLRSQVIGEELGVLFDMDTIVDVFKGKYDPDKWDTCSKEIMDKPYRPEVEQLIFGRGYERYTLGLYNTIEKEMLNVLHPNRSSVFEYMRFPGRIKYKVEHYLGCLGYNSGSDYERKVTEILINAKKQNDYVFNSMLKYLDQIVSNLEEKIFIDYSVGDEITTEATAEYAREMLKAIDMMYENPESFGFLSNEGEDLLCINLLKMN